MVIEWSLSITHASKCKKRSSWFPKRPDFNMYVTKGGFFTGFLYIVNRGLHSDEKSCKSYYLTVFTLLLRL